MIWIAVISTGTGLRSQNTGGLILTANRQKSTELPNSFVTIGDHIRKRRLELGLLQKETAERLGDNEASVYNWEHNRSSSAIPFIPGIVDFLGYDPTISIATSLSEKIRKYRTQHGLSQKKLATELGIDPLTVRRLEDNRGKPIRRILNKILQLLG